MPDSEGNWFAHVTVDDARAWPWVFGLLSLIFSTVVVIARVFARRTKWTWSDSCLVISYVVGLGYWWLLFDSLRHGLASKVTLSDESRVGALRHFASRAPLLFSTGTTRLSTAMTLTELVRSTRRKWLVMSLTYAVLVGIWTLAAPPFAMVFCAPAEPREIWMCSGEIPRRLTMTTIDSLIEVGLVVLPSVMFMKLQMPWIKKARVMLAFMCRLMVVASTVAHYVAYEKYLRDGRLGIDLATILVLEACLIFSGILTASVPVLLHMLAEFGSIHLLKTNHISSSYQLSALALNNLAGVQDGGGGYRSGASAASTTYHLGRYSQDSEDQIIGQD